MINQLFHFKSFWQYNSFVLLLLKFLSFGIFFKVKASGRKIEFVNSETNPNRAKRISASIMQFNIFHL